MKEYNINEKLLELDKQAKIDLKEIFEEINNNTFNASVKVLKAFQEEGVNESDFMEITGYGDSDNGRDKLERIYSRVFNCEDALVRPQIMSGTHALYIALSGLLRYNDTLLSISGDPYDTLKSIIGIDGNSESSLIKCGIKYEQIDLINDEFDLDKIKERLEKDYVKVVEIQRSTGYSLRRSLHVDQIEQAIKLVKEVSPDTIILVDNCYGEFVQDKEPTDVGADVIVSSLMKNLGSGIATSGGYIAGKEKYVELISERLSAPTLGKYQGANFNQLLSFYKGLYFAPSVVNSALKTQIYACYMMEKLGYNVTPKYNERRSDIITKVELGDKDKMIKFVQGLQKGGPVESNIILMPADNHGYDDQLIMAGPSFTPGSTIELSGDGPIREPYIVYMQGGLTYEYGRLGILIALNNIGGNL